MQQPTSTEAAILTIGTEVTSGQINDTNSSWLANELTNLKYNVTLHISVADVHEDIVDALTIAESKTKTIIMTGGLGPTSDDITRHAVAAWLNSKLQFDKQSWERIEKRLSALGLSIANSNKQQCYFPEGARILVNETGTANGFCCKKGEIEVFIFPGPPREIKRIWKDHSYHMLRSRNAMAQENRLIRITTLGKSESALAEIVEETIAGSSFTTGYRPHIPYVEIKLWSYEKDWDTNQIYLEKLKQAVSPWLVSDDGTDLAQSFVTTLCERGPFTIYDMASNGILAERCGYYLRRQQNTHSGVIHCAWGISLPSDENQMGCTIEIYSPNDQGFWNITVKLENALIEKQELVLPFPTSKMPDDRLARYIAEASMQAILKIFESRES